jgi:hypothetical protein
MIGFGLALLVLGMFILLLGFAALVNHSVLCLVHPGGGDCPVDRYQVALLAPLYSIGGEMMMIGSIMVVAGSAFTVLGSQKPEKMPGISAT